MISFVIAITLIIIMLLVSLLKGTIKLFGLVLSPKKIFKILMIAIICFVIYTYFGGINS